MKKRDYREYNLQDVFDISSESPTGLIWKIPRKYGGVLKYDRVGKPAGSLCNLNNGRSYYVVKIFGISFLTHRVAYLLYNGDVNPENDVDHIDGNTLNNKIENLREVSPAINSRNTRKRFPNKELENGITCEEYISKAGNTIKRIRAWCRVIPLETKSRSFSVNKYGLEKAIQLAKEWRLSKMKEAEEIGIPYTDRNGV